MHYPNIRELDHPVINHLITQLRSDASGPGTFRNLTRQIARLLAYEAFAKDRTKSTKLSWS